MYTLQRFLPHLQYVATLPQGRIQEFEKGGAQLPPPLPSPSLPSPPLASSSRPSPLLRSRPPLIQLEKLGERCKLSSWSPGRKSNFGIFGAQKRHLVARI